MSASTSLHEIESATHIHDGTAQAKEETFEKLLLVATSPPNSGPVIAVDLDDVLSQTNQIVAECKMLALCRVQCRQIHRAQRDVRDEDGSYLLLLYVHAHNYSVRAV